MVFGPGAGPQVRARIAALKQQLSLLNRQADAEEAARRLDADEVGQRADRRKAEREAAADRSRDSPLDR